MGQYGSKIQPSTYTYKPACNYELTGTSDRASDVSEAPPQLLQAHGCLSHGEVGRASQLEEATGTGGLPRGEGVAKSTETGEIQIR